MNFYIDARNWSFYCFNEAYERYWSVIGSVQFPKSIQMTSIRFSFFEVYHGQAKNISANLPANKTNNALFACSFLVSILYLWLIFGINGASNYISPCEFLHTLASSLCTRCSDNLDRVDLAMCIGWRMGVCQMTSCRANWSLARDLLADTSGAIKMFPSAIWKLWTLTQIAGKIQQLTADVCSGNCSRFREASGRENKADCAPLLR